MSEIDELILTIVKSDKMVDRAEAMAKLRELAVKPLNDVINEQNRAIIEKNVKLKEQKDCLAKSTETVQKQQQQIMNIERRVDDQKATIKQNQEQINKLTYDNKKAQQRLENATRALAVEKGKNTMVDEHLDFYSGFTILEVNTKFNIPSGKLMKWARKNSYVAAIKVEVLEAGKKYFTILNKSGFKSIGVTPEGVNLIRGKIDEILC